MKPGVVSKELSQRLRLALQLRPGGSSSAAILRSVQMDKSLLCAARTDLRPGQYTTQPRTDLSYATGASPSDQPLHFACRGSDNSVLRPPRSKAAMPPPMHAASSRNSFAYWKTGSRWPSEAQHSHRCKPHGTTIAGLLSSNPRTGNETSRLLWDPSLARFSLTYASIPAPRTRWKVSSSGGCWICASGARPLK